MNDRLAQLREKALRREFRELRQPPASDGLRWAFSRDEAQNATALFALRCREEQPIVLPDERICFMRSRMRLTQCLSDVSAAARLFRIRLK